MDIWMFPKIVGFTPKSSILIRFSIIFTIHFGVPLCLENTHIFSQSLKKKPSYTPFPYIYIFSVNSSISPHVSSLSHRFGFRLASFKLSWQGTDKWSPSCVERKMQHSPCSSRSSTAAGFSGNALYFIKVLLMEEILHHLRPVWKPCK